MGLQHLKKICLCTSSPFSQGKVMQLQIVPRRKEGWVKLSWFPGCMNNERFHIKAQAQDHKGCGLSRIPTPVAPTAQPPALAGLEETTGLWENGADRCTALEAEAGGRGAKGCTRVPALPFFSHSHFGLPPAGLSFLLPLPGQPGSEPGSSPIGGTVRLSPGSGCPAAPTAGPLGQRTALPHRTRPRVPEILKAEPSTPQRPTALHGRRWC